MTKETGILIAFHTEETTNMDEKNRSTEELSLKCLVPGWKFGSFVKNYDTYKPVLNVRILTNNGSHDAVLAPNWNWIDRNYGEKKEEKEVWK